MGDRDTLVAHRPDDVTWQSVPVFETTGRHDCANSMGCAHGGFLSALVDIATGQGRQADTQ